MPLPDVNIKATRERLGMTQAKFSEQFRINLYTLKDWESGRYPPTGPARVLLMVIDRAPDAVLNALNQTRPLVKVA